MSLRDDPLILEHKGQLEIRVREITEYIANGKCSSYDDYKRHVGVIRGMNISLEVMADVIKNYGDEDD